ncbi:MAG: hypothetical protein JST17_14210 [Bacteroidetes bacterium]|nr:hypothetical protein [Bacteroidota bacterium]MBS1930642.1 hypothetical protein [Bacteroidota bacterium]
MRKFSFLFLALSIVIASLAQNNSFMIYSFKGNVSILENKVESKPKVGKILNSSSSVKVSPGAVLTLICNQNALFTIKKAGNYSLEQFKDSCAISKSSLSANYARYVWEQMTSHGEGAPGTNRKMFMNTVGAVSRSVNNIWIDPRLDTINYASGNFPLTWKSYSDANEFDFFLYDNASATNPVYKTTTKEMQIPITSILKYLKEGNTYYWTSAVKGENNDEIKVINYTSKNAYEDVLNQLKESGPAYEGEAEQAFRIAFGLEDARYYAEAYQYYQKAANLKPDVWLYRSTMMSFKKDYDIK